MAIRDLQYPDDAIKTVNSLHKSLRYGASIATLGARCQDLSMSPDGQFRDVRVRASGADEDAAVQRDAPILLSRFALIYMLSQFEIQMSNLLLQRRVLEHLAPDKRMQPGELWNIIKRVDRESRVGPVKMTFGKIVTSPSDRLNEMKPWLEGLYAVRNCLAHRNGQVSLVDVAPDRRTLELTRDSDTLQATWLRVNLKVDGAEIELPFVHPGGDLQVSIEPFTREWRIGDHIDVTPSEIQGISLAFSRIGNEILRNFTSELDEALGPSA